MGFTTEEITHRLRDALNARAALIERLHSEQTDCYRLLQGAVEGCPGLSVDRYGPILLVQTWRDPLPEGSLEAIHATATEALSLSLTPVWNHRGKRPKESFDDWSRAELPDGPLIGAELGLRYDVRPRHRGIDPLLFLDFRAGRRRVLQASKDATVLNLFSYTCGIGVCAAVGGAKEVLNVDFAASALAVGHDNAALNDVASPPFATLQENVIPVIRQFASLSVGLRARQRRQTRFTRLDPRQFDLVILDPPRWAKTPFGAIDTVRDYQGLFKPSLLATRPGGQMLVTNNVAHVDVEEWSESLRRCAKKAARPLRDLEIIHPEEDFPSPDGHPPLKMAWLSV